MRAKQGDRAAFERLARCYLRVAYAVALAQVGRPDEAEDAAQEAMVTALEQIDGCKDPVRFGGWLVQIARNKGRNAVKRRRFR